MTDDNSILHEAYRQAEKRLEWQFTSAIAADQRAVSIAGFLVGASAIIAALAERALAPAALLVGAMGLLLAAFLAWSSARPQSFFAPGAKFSDFEDDLAQAVNMDVVMTQIGGFHDKHIDTNNAAMLRCARLMHWSFRVAVLSVFLTVVSQLFVLWVNLPSLSTSDESTIKYVVTT
jgi:hypothetical protein